MKGHLFSYVISFPTYFSFLSINVTAGKLEAAMSVTSTYQSKGKKELKLITV